MQTVRLDYTVSGAGTSAEAKDILHNELIETLAAVSETGSLSAAAELRGVSFRQLWNRVNAWEAQFGVTLIERGQGRAARLTDKARRLLTAERAVQARYAQVIEEMRGSLEQVYAMAFSSSCFTVRAQGCADPMILAMRDALLGESLILDVSFSSSGEGLRALADGRCDLAGFNFPSGAGSKAAAEFGDLLDPERHTLIGFAERLQGIAVQPGNPLGLRSFLDIALRKARYVNRVRGTGTRVLCERLLATSGLSPESLNGYRTMADSHRQAAMMIAAGEADAALCTAQAAAQEKLGFIPLTREIYCLACEKAFLRTPAAQTLLQFLESDSWKERAATAAGYDFAICAQILPVTKFFACGQK